MAKNRKKESDQPNKKKKVKETHMAAPSGPGTPPKSKWQEFINKHAVSKQQ